MFYVKVLKDLEREGAIVFLGWYGLKDLFECVDDVGDDELVFLIYCVTVLLVLLTEDPTIHSFCYRDLFLFEQAQQCLNQYLPIILIEQL